MDKACCTYLNQHTSTIYPCRGHSYPYTHVPSSSSQHHINFGISRLDLLGRRTESSHTGPHTMQRCGDTYARMQHYMSFCLLIRDRGHHQHLTFHSETKDKVGLPPCTFCLWLCLERALGGGIRGQNRRLLERRYGLPIEAFTHMRRLLAHPFFINSQSSFSSSNSNKRSMS